MGFREGTTGRGRCGFAAIIVELKTEKRAMPIKSIRTGHHQHYIDRYRKTLKDEFKASTSDNYPGTSSVAGKGTVS